MPKSLLKPAPAAPAAGTQAVRNLGKITAPTLQRVFGNERLFARLDAARFYPVVWLHGPPGAGKTTLAASYLAARCIKPLWCRLDEGDCDPASVFLYLAEAARLCAPGLELPLLRPEFRTALSLFTRRFFRDLFAADGVPVVVLDDYHEVAVDAELHDCLPAGLEEVPDGCQVIVISRAAPPSQLARLRLNGRIDVIEPDALRLNTKEIRALAHKRGVDAPARAEHRIVDATQGWTAGVIVLLEASAETPVACPIEGRAQIAPVPEVLFDYFAGEILQRMEPWVPTVLSTLALLPTMTAATAERLTGRPEAGALLEDLYRRNYFTARDSAADPRYRFHPLFRDFLRAAARKQDRDETLLKIRAAAVLEEDGQADAAVHLLVETGQTETLAALVKRRAGALVEEGRNDTLIAWLSKLGDAQIASDAWLSYWRGAARVGFDPIDAYPHFLSALARFEADDDATGQFAAWAGAAEAVRLEAFGDATRFDPLVVKMHRLLERHPAFPSPALEMTVSAAMATALSRRGSSRAECETWTARARAMADIVNVPALSIRLGFAFAIMDALDGHFRAAKQAIASLPDPLALDHLPLAQWAGLMAKSIVLAHGQGTEDPEAFTSEALKRLEQSGLVLWMPLLAANVAVYAFWRNDLATCERWCARTYALADRAHIPRGTLYYTAAAGHRLLLSDFAGALIEAEKGIEAAAKRGYRYFDIQTRLMRAIALVLAGELDAAASELDWIEAAFATSMANSLAFPAGILRAELLYARGEAAAADAVLAATLAAASRQGSPGGIMDSRISLRAYKRAIELDIEPEFVRTLIRSLGLGSPDPFDGAWPWPIKITTLGTFAIEIDGKRLAFSGKTPRRLITLVKAIAAYGGRAVPEAKIADAVWPDEEGDAASNSLSIAIHRLRKLLGDNEAIVVSNGTIGFNRARCWLDLWTLEHLTAEASGGDPAARCERLTALYKGDFLAEDEDLAWAKPPRETWRRRFDRAIRDATQTAGSRRFLSAENP